MRDKVVLHFRECFPSATLNEYKMFTKQPSTGVPQQTSSLRKHEQNGNLSLKWDLDAFAPLGRLLSHHRGRGRAQVYHDDGGIFLRRWSGYSYEVKSIRYKKSEKYNCRASQNVQQKGFQGKLVNWGTGIVYIHWYYTDKTFLWAALCFSKNTSHIEIRHTRVTDNKRVGFVPLRPLPIADLSNVNTNVRRTFGTL